jgi:hypothetical protein
MTHDMPLFSSRNVVARVNDWVSPTRGLMFVLIVQVTTAALPEIETITFAMFIP